MKIASDMLPSMPLISTPYKEPHNMLEMEISPKSSSPQNISSFASPPSPHVTQSCSDLEINQEKEIQRHVSAKALDLSVTTNIPSKKSSPLKHVTPILKKYNSHRKGKGSKKPSLISKGVSSDQLQKGMEKQCLRPIAARPVNVMFSSAQGYRNVTPQLGQSVLKDGKTNMMKVEEEQTCATETSGIQRGSEEKKGTVNDERTSEEKDMSAEQKDNEDDLLFLMSASTTVRPPKGRMANVVKKKTKQLKDMESTLALLTPDNPTVREEKSYGFAQAYFLKVKERLEGTELYQEFLNVMNEFGTSILDVSDLYSKVTGILKQHPDLCEEFVAFLLPEQAMQCGKFMEYLLITKMRDFFRKLEMYFEKQPQQVQRIYTYLSTLSNTSNVSVGDVCSAIVPLLKGNSVLIENFMALLPHEKPAESLMPEFEYVDLGDVDNEQVSEEDMFETLTVPDQQDAYGGDNCVCMCHNSHDDKYHSRAVHCMSCGTRFIHGKVFVQTGKVLRPAKVVFLSESNNDSINRLSAKSKPKGRNRRRTASQSEAASSSKDSSPAKLVNVNHSPDGRNEANENGGASNQMSKSNVKSSSPKCARTTKSKLSLMTHKAREKPSPVKIISASKTFSDEDKDCIDYADEQKRSGSAYSGRLDCNKEIAFATKPMVLLHDIASDVNSSSVSVTIPNISTRNSSSAQSSMFKDVSDSLTLTSAPNAKLHDAGPASARDASNTAYPAASSHGVSSPEVVRDEGAALPSDTPSVECSVKDTNTLTTVICGTEDAECESMDTNSSSHNADLTGEMCDSVSHEVGFVSGEVKGVVECKEVTVCDTAVGDVIMSENEGEVSASESAQIKLESEPAGPHQTHCNSDSPSGSWTREEDRTILQMFQLDCGMEQTFMKIGERLPVRTLDEIKSRFKMLIALLHQMTGTKMEEDSNISIQ